MRASRIISLIFMALAVGLFVTAAVFFLAKDDTTNGIVCLVSGSALLCFGSVFFNAKKR